MTRHIKFIALFIAAAALVVGLASPAGAAGVSPTEEQHFASAINDLRRSKGVAPMALDGHLSEVARAWTHRMVASGGISHNPNLATDVRHHWQKLGENVGRGSSVVSLHYAFVASPGHYQNLVDPAYTHMGIGAVRAPDGQLFTTHVFMRGTATQCPAVRDSISRLYRAYFLRTPDAAGLQYWLSQYSRGHSLVTISDTFTRTAEYASRYAGLDHSGFLSLVYKNVLGRTPDAGGKAYWYDVLVRGVLPRGGVMIRFSESPEFVAKTGTLPPAPC